MCRVHLSLILLLLSTIPSLGASSYALVQADSVDTFTAITFGPDNSLIAVGSNSVARLSKTFGTSWSTLSIGTNNYRFTSVAASTTGYLVGDSTSHLFSSPDGLLWKPEPAISTGFDLVALIYSPRSNGTFVALSDYQRISWNTADLAGWKSSTFQGDRLFDGFTSVATTGEGNFVLCGAGSLVRASMDAGRSWTFVPGRAPNAAASNLRGIAVSDKQFVAVGDRGIVLTLDVQSSRWATNRITTNNLNGVAYSGTIFTAVGDGGVIFNSSDGVGWVQQPSPTTNSLFALTYGQASPALGLLVSVGAKGTIVVGQPVPPKPVKVGDVTVCSGISPIPTLRVVVTNGVAVDWFDVAQGGSVLSGGANTTNFVPTVPAGNNSILRSYWAQSRNKTTGIINNDREEVVFQINPRPTVQSLSVKAGSSSTVCERDSTILRAILSGEGPWEVTWSDLTSPITYASNAIERTVSPGSTKSYSITSLSDSYCAARSAEDLKPGVQVTVIPSPKSKITDTTLTVCEGDLVILKATLEGVGPWDVLWSDGERQNSWTSSTLIREIRPTESGTYSIVGLSGKGCSGLREDLKGQINVSVSPRPTAQVSTSTPQACFGDRVEILVNLTGARPWVLKWSDGVTQNAESSPASRTITNSNANASLILTNTYSVTNLVDANKCPSRPTELQGKATVLFLPKVSAVASGSQSICSGDPAPIQVALGGVGPWRITWSDAFVQETNRSPAIRTVYVNSANPLKSTTNTFTLGEVTGLFGCKAQPGDLKGQATIVAVPRPTASLSGDTAICSEGNATVQVTFSGVGPWNATWSDAPNKIETYTTSVIRRIVSPTTTASYRLQTLKDKNCSALSESLTSEVRIEVLPRPKAKVTGDHLICGSGLVILEAQLEGTSPWRVVWSDGHIQTGVVDRNLRRDLSLTNTNPNLSVTNRYSIRELSDASCTARASDLTGQSIVIVRPNPSATVSGGSSVCSGQPVSVAVSLTGTAPWIAKWSDGETYTYTSTPTNRILNPTSSRPNATESLQLSITNLSYLDCQPSAPTLKGFAQISVNPLPTARLNGGGTICLGGSAEIQAELTGIGPWTITWSDSSTKQVTNSPSGVGPFMISRRVAPTTTTSYTLLTVVDRNLCSAQPANSGDPVTITVTPRIGATITGPARTICSGETQEISVSFSGEGPWTLTWSDGSVQTATSSPALLKVNPTNTNSTSIIKTNYSIVRLENNTCEALSSDLKGSILFTVNPRPSASLTGSATLCAGSTNTLQVALKGVAPWVLTWSDNFKQTNQTSIAKRSVSPSQTTAYWLTNLRDKNCESTDPNDLGEVATVTITERPTATVSGGEDLCSGGEGTIAVSLTGEPPWRITWSDGFIQSNLTSHTVTRSIRITNTSSSTLITNRYSVKALSSGACDGLPGGLQGIAEFRVRRGPSAVVSGTNSICTGLTTTLLLTLTGEGPWDVSWSDGVVQRVQHARTNRILVGQSDFPNSSTLIILTVTNLLDSHCRALMNDLKGRGQVTVFPSPTASLSGGGVACSGTTNLLTIALTGVSPWTLSWSDGVKQTSTSNVTYRRVPITNTVTRSIGLVSLKDKNCEASAQDLGGQISLIPAPRPTAKLSGTNKVCSGDVFRIPVLLTGTGPWKLTWQDGLVQDVEDLDHAFREVALSNTNLSRSITNIYTLKSLADTVCEARATDLTGRTMLITPPRPTSLLAVANGRVCSGESVLLSLALTGTKPWTVTWSDNVTETYVHSTTNRRVTPKGLAVFTVKQLSDANCSALSTDMKGNALASVAAPPAAPVSLGDRFNLLAGTTNPPLAVLAVTNVAIDWYQSASGGSPIVRGTNVFVPTNGVVGTYTYYAEARNASLGCLSTNRTPVKLTLQLGLIAQPTQSSNALISWYGNARLQATTNLLPTPGNANWINVRTGQPARLNLYTNRAVGEERYFRLFQP